MMTRKEYLEIAGGIYDRCRRIIEAGKAAGAFEVEAKLERSGESSPVDANLQHSLDGEHKSIIQLWVAVDSSGASKSEEVPT